MIIHKLAIVTYIFGLEKLCEILNSALIVFLFFSWCTGQHWSGEIGLWIC